MAQLSSRFPRIIGKETVSKGRKEMFYLTTQSTHFIYDLYGVGHMVKDHSDCHMGYSF